MSAVQHSEEHRVTALARGLREELSHVSTTPLWSMAADEAGDVLVLLAQVRSQLDALQMRVLRHAETVGTGADVGATATSWWAGATRATRAEANRTVRLAAALERHDEVAVALGRGDLRADQARVIVEVRCRVDRSVARTRYDQRQRDPRHLDDLRTDDELWGHEVAPLGVGPLIEVDTTQPVDVRRVAEQIRSKVDQD